MAHRSGDGVEPLREYSNFIERRTNCFTVLRSGKQISSADQNRVTYRFVRVSFSVGGNWRVVNDSTWALKCVAPTESYLRFWDFIENTQIRLSDMVPFAFWNSTAVGFVFTKRPHPIYFLHIHIRRVWCISVVVYKVGVMSARVFLKRKRIFF